MKLIYYIFLLFFVISCEESLNFNNPLDDFNPDFIPPETIITNYDSLNESTIDTSSVTIFWKGNEFVKDYSYNLDSTQWSGWSADTSVTLNNLSNGFHIFYVKSRFGSGIEDETPATVTFTVDYNNP